MRLWWSFRSPYVPCFSIATEPVNVPGWLTATTLATRAPGQENRRWRGPFVLCRLTFGSGTSLRPCRLSPPPASLRAAPVSRQRLIDFQPDSVIAVTVLFSLRGVTAVKRNITGIPQPTGRGLREGKNLRCIINPGGRYRQTSRPAFLPDRSLPVQYPARVCRPRQRSWRIPVKGRQSMWANVSSAPEG